MHLGSNLYIRLKTMPNNFFKKSNCFYLTNKKMYVIIQCVSVLLKRFESSYFDRIWTRQNYGCY